MKKVIQFTRFRGLPLIISLLLLITGLVFTIVNNGFNLGVDFQAGLNLQVKLQAAFTVNISDLRASLSEFEGIQIQVLGGEAEQRFTIRIRDDGSIANFSQVRRSEIVESIEATFGESSLEILSEDYVEPRFAANLSANTTILVIAAMACILAYLWIRFRFVYALSSLVALLHDISFMVLFIGTFQIEVSTATIAAILTIIGYSLNDTIVIFDRIRENEKLLTNIILSEIIDKSITQSLSRTIVTSLTTLLAVTSIFIFTTGAIQNFALNMIVGVVIGTYSSIFVASPVFLLLNKRKKQSHRTQSTTSDKAATLASPSSDPQRSNLDIDTSSVIEEIRAQKARKKKHRS